MMTSFTLEEAQRFRSALQRSREIYRDEWRSVSEKWRDLTHTWNDSYSRDFESDFQKIYDDYELLFNQLEHHLASVEQQIQVVEKLNSSITYCGNTSDKQNANYPQAVFIAATVATYTPKQVVDDSPPRGVHKPTEGDKLGNGVWSGTPGNSIFYPNRNNEKYQEAIKAGYLEPGEGVSYEKGYPNFDRWAEHFIDVPNMNGDHKHDEGLAHQAFARLQATSKAQGMSTVDDNLKWVTSTGRPIARRSKEYMAKKELTFHHHPNGKSMQAVPTIVHDTFRHSGGAAHLRNQTTEND